MTLFFLKTAQLGLRSGVKTSPGGVSVTVVVSSGLVVHSGVVVVAGLVVKLRPTVRVAEVV